jgi:hypothetical protein
MTEQITKLSQLNWTGWMLGLWGALISGVTSATTVGVIDPADFNFHDKKLYMLFAIPAGVSFIKFLALHPAPDPLPQEVVANVKTTTTITPVDSNVPETKITSSTPITGPVADTKGK